MSRFCILFFLMLVSCDLKAKNITSLDITEATLKGAKHCLRYKFPTRFCVWISPFAGKTVTPVVDHYSPDLVVTVYRNSGDNPWVEVRSTLDAISFSAQEKVIHNVSNGNHSFLDPHEQNVVFKEVDVIGNPGLLVIPKYFDYLFLPSTAMPLRPYYQSMTDSMLWRGFMPESLPEEAVSIPLNITHHVGSGLVDWGGVYPHEGSVVGNNDAKASMVIAQRATDLITNNNAYGHIRQLLSNDCGEHCKASSITENSDETLFQMIYPIEQDDCSTFGSEKSYNPDMLNDKGAYAWIVWRHYQGCPEGEGIFLGVIP